MEDQKFRCPKESYIQIQRKDQTSISVPKKELFPDHKTEEIESHPLADGFFILVKMEAKIN